jgi:uncharacterized membrane protein YphA (DoxX/SURF4 family)
MQGDRDHSSNGALIASSCKGRPSLVICLILLQALIFILHSALMAHGHLRSITKEQRTRNQDCLKFLWVSVAAGIAPKMVAFTLFEVPVGVCVAAGIEPKMVAFTLMLGASSSFMSPYGYPPNLMVFNAGNMKAVDLIKIGVPLQVCVCVCQLDQS